jgi:hypothetical protein
MRFSLKWLLGATAYLALVAAAIGSGGNGVSNAVWAVSFLVLTYAAVTACHPRSERQAAAIGFSIVATAHLAGLWFIADRLPAAHFFSVIGYSVSDGDVYVRVFQPIENEPSQVTYRRVPIYRAVVRTANAIATMIAGLVGCAIGALAYRQNGQSAVLRAAGSFGDHTGDRQMV